MTITSLKSKFVGDSMLAGNDDPGALVPIQRVTVGAGGASSVTFSGIPQTYTHLQIRGITLPSGASPNFVMQMNGDTGSNYATHELSGDGASASSAGLTSTTYILAGAFSATTGVVCPLVLDLLDYSSTSKYKTTRSITGSDNNGSGSIALRSGVWMSTSAVASISLFWTSGNSNQYSTFALYGIKVVGQ